MAEAGREPGEGPYRHEGRNGDGPGITAPIASATSLDQLNELMKSLELELDPSAIELLNRASA
jgi:hypothetical protein